MPLSTMAASEWQRAGRRQTPLLLDFPQGTKENFRSSRQFHEEEWSPSFTLGWEKPHSPYIHGLVTVWSPRSAFRDNSYPRNRAALVGKPRTAFTVRPLKNTFGKELVIPGLNQPPVFCLLFLGKAMTWLSGVPYSPHLCAWCQVGSPEPL